VHIETIITIEALASKIEEIAAAVPAQQAFVADLKGEVNRAAADLEWPSSPVIPNGSPSPERDLHER
jgi:hypothetical protein